VNALKLHCRDRAPSLPVALAIAVVGAAAAIVLDQPWIASTVAPALWVSLFARPRCGR